MQHRTQEATRNTRPDKMRHNREIGKNIHGRRQDKMRYNTTPRKSSCNARPDKKRQNTRVDKTSHGRRQDKVQHNTKEDKEDSLDCKTRHGVIK